MRLKIKVLALVLPSIFIFSKIALSEPVPQSARAGVVERTLDLMQAFKSRPAKEEPISELESPMKEMQEPLPAGKKVLVRAFAFKRNTLFTKEYLDKLVSSYTDKELSMKELKEVCNLIAKEYRDRGYFLARAYVPAQGVEKGIVLIDIIEGLLGEVVIDGGKYYKKKFTINHFRASNRGIINYHVLLRSLLVLNEYPDLKIKALLRKGQMPYSVDIVLKVEDKLPLHFAADYNNFGSRYVSKNRSGASAEYSNLIIGGDKAYIRGVVGSPARNQGFAEGKYSLPINSYGTRAEFSYTWSEFDVQREFRKLDAGGHSEIYSFNLDHPLIRNLLTDVNVLIGFDYKQIKNYLLGAETSDDELRVFKAGLSGSHLDNLKGRNYFSALLSQGIPDIMGGLKRNDINSSRSGSGAGGEFTKGNFDLARYQQFIGDTFILIKNSVQVSSDALSVPEQMAIGGADSVRGYSQSEFLGDSGYIGNLEFRFYTPFISRWKIPFAKKTTFKDLVQFVGFLDYGNIYRKNASLGENKHDEIVGTGIGARFNITNDFTFRVDVGWPIGQEPSDGANTHTYLQGVLKI